MSGKRTIAVALALAALIGASTPASGFKGTDEELARELAGRLKELASVADDLSEVGDVDGAVDKAAALIDWVESTAPEISQRIKEQGDSSNLRYVEALAKAREEAGDELRKYPAGESSPKACAEALRDVVEAGEVVVKILASKQ